MIPADDVYIWGIAFTDGHDNWFDIFTRKGFEHCFCWRECEGGILVFNYLAYRSDVQYIPVKLSDYGAYLAENNHTVLFYSHKPQVKMIYRWLFNCVSAVEAAVGIKLPLVYTPYRLYSALKQMGATELEVAHG